MTRVLMATDGSVHASGAMLAASHLLRRADLLVDVLCVAPELSPQAVPVLSAGRAEVHEAYKEHLTRPYRRILKDALSILGHSHLKAGGLLETGDPSDRILQIAPSYDLTVIGAYGNHERKQPGLGPVSSRLLQMSTGNIMIGRELVNQNSCRVLLGLDSSESSFAALNVLCSLFDLGSLEVTLMHVLELPWARLGCSRAENLNSSELSDYQTQLGEELKRAAHAALERGRRKLEAHSVPVATLIEEGDPALELSRQAEEGGYDMVVVGATGTADVKHALLGSVSLKVAWDAPCSVVVVRQAP